MNNPSREDHGNEDGGINEFPEGTLERGAPHQEGSSDVERHRNVFDIKVSSHPSTALLWTGGTIASEKSRVDDIVRPTLTGHHFVNRYLPPAFKKRASFTCFTPHKFPATGFDSTESNPRIMNAIVHRIYELLNQKELAGIVVTHGTDTMTSTAAYAALALQDLRCPVAFTGAQIRPDLEDASDAFPNVALATRAAKSDLLEVVIAFSDKILRGIASVKDQAVLADGTFRSPHQPPLAVMKGERLRFDPHVHSRTLAPARSYGQHLTKYWKLDESLGASELPVHFFPGLSGHSFVLDLNAATEKKVIKKLLNPAEFDAVVILGYASGNIPMWMQDVIEDVQDDMHVIAAPGSATEVEPGSKYAGSPDVSHPGITYAKGMTSVAALIKERWLHAMGRNLHLHGKDLLAWKKDRYRFNVAGETIHGGQEDDDMHAFPNQRYQWPLWLSPELISEMPQDEDEWWDVIHDIQKNSQQRWWVRKAQKLGLQEQELQQWVDNRSDIPLPWEDYYDYRFFPMTASSILWKTKTLLRHATNYEEASIDLEVQIKREEEEKKKKAQEKRP